MNDLRMNDRTTEKPIQTGPVICTIINKNYLSFARVLTDSFLKHNASGKVVVLLIDKVDGYFIPEKERFELITIDQLWDQRICQMLFHYNVTEMCTAIKPYFLEYLLREYKIDKIIYLDPDILITNDLDDLWQLIDRYSIILTPHLTEPISVEDKHTPSEIGVLHAGTFNLGFIAIANTETTKAFLKWWQERLYRMCLSNHETLFVDQKWINLIHGYFDDIYVLRDPGYNVAYWNLQDRIFSFKKDDICVNNHVMRFFHFSGFNPENMEQISKHQNRFVLNRFKQLRPLFKTYKAQLIAQGYADVKTWPYAFGYLDNGLKIADIMRRIYWSQEESPEQFGNPFSVDGTNSFFRWLNESADGTTGHPIVTRLWYNVWLSRPDVQQAYPNIRGENRQDFLNWCATSGISEHNIDRAFLQLSLTSQPKSQKKFNFDRIKTLPYSRLWIPLKSIVSNVIIKVFSKNQDLLNELSVISQRIESILAPHNNSPSITKLKAPVEQIDKPDGRGINISGFARGEFGGGAEVRATIRAAEAADVPFVINNVELPGHIYKDTTVNNFADDNPYHVNVIHVSADLSGWFHDLKSPQYTAGKYNVGYWAWELARFPAEWHESFKYYNELWVLSNFVMDSISKVSPIPVVRIFSVHVDESKIKADRAKFGLDKDSYVFLYTFDFRSYFQRKNPIAVINAFKMAFGDSNSAVLVVKYINHKQYPLELEILKKATSGADNIKLVDSHFRSSELYSLVASCDCYVSLHRSEGFGLTIADAMYLGKPVIATGYSGNMDYMNVNNSFPVKYKLVEVGEKDYPLATHGYVWAEPDIYHAAELMKRVFEDRKQALNLGKQASHDIKTLFSPGVAGQEIRRRLNIIYDK